MRRRDKHMASFLTSASKKTTDIRGFLREAAGSNSIKYLAEKGKKHILYVPFNNVVVTDDNGVETTTKQITAISGSVHEWSSPDGKYQATICLKDVIRKADDGETLLNDGTCPFCDRVTDGWDIYRYRRELEESNCKMTGEDRKKYLETINGNFADERKAKEARDYIYMLVVKFRTDDSGKYVMGQDGLPEYDLKVMKMSASRVDKLQQQIENSGLELPGSEFTISYPNSEDRRLVVSQSITAPVFPEKSTLRVYPALVGKIQTDIAKFQWDGMEKSFPEWAGMNVSKAKQITDTMFEKWDEYKKEMLVNPSAKYLEYVSNTNVTNPALSAVTPNTAPVMPGVAPVMPGAAPVIGAGLPDVNQMFANAPAAPSITI